MLSDERSKERIQRLESLNERYKALLDEGAEYPSDEELGRARTFEDVGSHSFEYKPEFRAEGGRGRFAGPMTAELRGIPGVVKKGSDGMERVDTDRLTMANASATGELARDKADREELEALRERFAALSDDPDSVLSVASGESEVSRGLQRLESLPRGPMSATDRRRVAEVERMGF